MKVHFVIGEEADVINALEEAVYNHTRQIQGRCPDKLSADIRRSAASAVGDWFDEHGRLHATIDVESGEMSVHRFRNSRAQNN